jgi:hypothetical protein
MLRIFFSLILGFWIDFISAQQNVEIQTYLSEIGVWNNYRKEWIWQPSRPCNVRFILQGNSIISNDLEGSSYYTYYTIDSEPPELSWKALDEKRRECIIMMNFKEGYTYFIIMYANECIRYVY